MEDEFAGKLKRKAEALKRAAEAMKALDPCHLYDKDTRLRESDAQYKQTILRLCRDLYLQGACEVYRISGIAAEHLELEDYRKNLEECTRVEDCDFASFEKAWMAGESAASEYIDFFLRIENYRRKLAEKKKAVKNAKWMDLSELKGTTEYTRKWLIRSLREKGPEDCRPVSDDAPIAVTIQKDGRRLYAVEAGDSVFCLDPLPGLGWFLPEADEAERIRQVWGEQSPSGQAR